MDYFTVDGVILRTGYRNKADWYLLPIREILDNDTDFLWKYYKGADDTYVNVDITKDDKLFRIKIRNSNYKNIPVFPDLNAIFDYDMRYGSKQDVHIISRGMLGDAMKQILSLGYVLTHVNDDETTLGNKQWDHPLIIRHNGKEWKIYLHVDKHTQEYYIRPELSTKELTHTDTEIEVVLPIIDEVRSNLNRYSIESFCRKYTVFTTDISFKFRILDDSSSINSNSSNITTTSTASQQQQQEHNNINNSNEELMTQFMEVLSKPPPKAILNIEVPALHPIATDSIKDSIKDGELKIEQILKDIKMS